MSRATAMPRRTEPPLTFEQMQRALQRLRKPHWPATLTAALQHPLYGPLVRGLARCLMRGAARDTDSQPATPIPSNRAPKTRRLRGPTVDFRSLAANDIDHEDDQ